MVYHWILMLVFAEASGAGTPQAVFDTQSECMTVADAAALHDQQARYYFECRVVVQAQNTGTPCGWTDEATSKPELCYQLEQKASKRSWCFMYNGNTPRQFKRWMSREDGTCVPSDAK